MLNKKVILGGLFAGAILLPAMANAGVVTGQCVNCHTMHASTNGVTSTPNATLLRAGSSCAGCHATGNANASNGRYDNGSFAAPQVDDATNTLSAGYFSKDNTHDVQQHNPAADLGGAFSTMTYDANLGTTPPGGGAAMGTFGCVDCHDASGGHHGAGGTTYRLLNGVTANTGDANFGVGMGAATPPQRSKNTYASTQMDTMCGNCHGLFHHQVLANQWNGSAWVRHPTDVDLAATDTANGSVPYDYTNNYAAYGDADILPLGVDTGSGDTQRIMCLTCHYAHGGANGKILAFDYTAIQAGDASSNNIVGCESCHNYASAGM